MYFKKTFSLATNTYATHAKSLVFQICLLAFVVALFGLFFFDFGSNLVKVIKDENLLTQAQELLSEIVNWGEGSEADFADNVEEFINSIRYIASAIPNFSQRLIVAVCLLFVAIYLLYLLSGFVLYVNTYVLNQFMSTNIRGFYLWTFFKRLTSNLKITLLSALLSLVWDFVAIIFLVGAYVMFLTAWGVWGIVLAFLLFVTSICLRKTIYAYWLPAYVNTEESIKLSFEQNVMMLFDDFWKIFLKTFIFAIVGSVMVLLVLMLFKVVAAAVVMTLIICFFSYLLTCAYMISYYENRKKSYFTKKVKITVEESSAE